MLDRIRLSLLVLVASISLVGCFHDGSSGDDSGSQNTVSFSTSTTSTNEGQTSIDITVTLTDDGSDQSPSFTVAYDTFDGTATAGADYQAASGTLSWDASSSNSQTISISLLDDSIAEYDETFLVKLSQATNDVVIGTAAIEVTIQDDEISIQLVKTEQTVDETQTNVNFAVSRIGSSSGAVSVDYATADGTATAGSDYQAASGTLSWADGETDNKIIQLTITDDGDNESQEDLTITLSNLVGSAVLGNDQVIVKINSDELPPAGTVQLDSTAWTMSEADGVLTISASRTGGTYGIASVGFTITDNETTANVDYLTTSGSITWLDGESGSKSADIEIVDDTAIEVDETMDVTLGDVVGATLDNTADTATITITSDDNYIFYTVNDVVVAQNDPPVNSNLMAVDPSNPASPTAVINDNTVLEGRKIPAGTWDAANLQVTNYRFDTVIVSRSDGTLYKVDATASASPLTLTQLSSETASTDACLSLAVPYADYANTASSSVVIPYKGVDATCGTSDDTYKGITLDMDSATAPVSVSPVLAVLRDPANGQITGYLTDNGTDVIKVDAAFANPTASLVTYTTSVDVLADNGSGLRYMVVDNDISVYNSADDSITALYTVTTGFDVNQYAMDATDLYFADGADIKQLTVDGADTTATTLTTAGGNISALYLIDQYVIFSTKSGTYEDGIYSIAKTAVGGTPSTLAVAAAGEGLSLQKPFDNAVRFNRFVDNTTSLDSLSASTVYVTGIGGTTVPNAIWVGFVYNDTLDVASPQDGGLFPSASILAEGCTSVTTLDVACNSGVLTLYPTGNMAAGISIGTAPADAELSVTANERVMTSLDATNKTIYMFDSETSDSLQVLATGVTDINTVQ